MGNPAKAQLARAVRNPEEAFNTMRGSFFVVETKFDGGLLHAVAIEFVRSAQFGVETPSK